MVSNYRRKTPASICSKQSLEEVFGHSKKEKWQSTRLPKILESLALHFRAVCTVPGSEKLKIWKVKRNWEQKIKIKAIETTESEEDSVGEINSSGILRMENFMVCI